MRVRVLIGERSRMRRALVLSLAVTMLAIVATRPAAQIPATVGPVRPGPPTPLAAAIARPPAAILAGEAVDAATGRGLDGVVVRLTCAAPGFEDARVLTEGNGGFAFTQVPSARCALEASKSGYADGAFGRSRPEGELRPVDVADRAVRTDLKVRLWKLGAITGAALDGRSQPIVALPIRVFEHAMVGGRPRLRLVGQTVTDDRGFYRLARLLPGEYVVGAMTTHTTLPASVVDRYFAPGGDQELLRQAIFRATPVITPPGSDQSLRVGDQIVQSVGRGPLPFPAPSGELLAFSTVFSPPMLDGTVASPLVLRAGEERAGVDLHLVAATTARVHGRAINDDGTPAALVALRLVARAAQFFDGGFDVGRTLTSADGSFTFVGVTPGEYAVRASWIDPAAVHQEVGVSVPASPAPMAWADESVVVGNADSSLTVRLKPGITFSGLVQFEGSATKPAAADVASIPIVIEAADRSAPDQMPETRINRDGTFVTGGVPAGRYYLRALGAPPGWNLQGAMLNGRDLSTTAIDVRAGEIAGVRLVFSDRSAEVSGRALAQPGALAIEARALLFPTSDRSWVDWGLNPRHIQSVRADSAGNFVFRNVPPGDYFVAAMPEASSARWSDPSTLQALVRSAARVTVVPGGRHTVSVRTTEVRR